MIPSSVGLARFIESKLAMWTRAETVRLGERRSMRGEILT